GIEYSTTEGFTEGAGTQVAADEMGTGEFTVAVTGLTAATTYYYRAYATNGEGTSYGDEVSFTTEAGSTPDSPYGRLYWSNFDGEKIESIHADGTGRQDVIAGIGNVLNAEGPNKISVDAVNEKIYWFDNASAIYRANLDGTDNVLLVENSGYIGGLYFNPLDQRLYWSNYDGKKIESTDADGMDRQEVIGASVGGFAEGGPRSITIDAVHEQV